MSDEAETSARSEITPGTNAIFGAFVFGSVVLLAFLMFMNRVHPGAMTAFAILLAFSGNWMPQLIQKLRDRVARRRSSDAGNRETREWL